MFIRTTLDPITLNEVSDPDNHPHLIIGDKNNGLDIVFESEATKRAYLNLELPHTNAFRVYKNNGQPGND